MARATFVKAAAAPRMNGTTRIRDPEGEIVLDSGSHINAHDERTGRANASTRAARSCCSVPGGSRRLPEESDASSLIHGIIRSTADQVWTRAVGELW